MQKNTEKPKKSSKNMQKHKKASMERFVTKAWNVIDRCLDVIEGKLLLLSEDVSSADLSKLTQMLGSVFDRLMSVSGDINGEQKVKKLEDFD